MGKVFLIKEEDGQAIADYLLKQPYKDVAALVNALSNLQQANIVEPTTEPVNEKGEEAEPITPPVQ